MNESQGTAFVHNIFAGATYLLREIKRFSMYHIPHDTAVLGSIFVYGGDDKIYNNIYIGHNKNWYYPGRPATHISGHSGFNNYRDSSHRPDTSKNDCPTGESENTLGVFFGGNSYFYGAQQCSHETDAKVDIDFPAYCRVVCENGDYYLETNLPDELFTVNHSIVDTKLLGKAFQSNAPYENRDGSPVSITEDYFGNSRNEANPCGPFAAKIPAKIFLFHEDNVAI